MFIVHKIPKKYQIIVIIIIVNVIDNNNNKCGAAAVGYRQIRVIIELLCYWKTLTHSW